MPTDEQQAYFSAFGFVVLDSIGSPELVSGLADEAASGFTAAYGAEAGSDNLYLPALAERTPISQSLTHDPGIVDAAKALLGCASVVCKPSKFVRYTKATSWHRDCYADLPAVKVVTYLEDTAEAATMEVVPGSHRDRVADYVANVIGISDGGRENLAPWFDQARIPTYRIIIPRGAVLMFDVNIWHANHRPSQRLQWTTTYLSEPDTKARTDDVVTYLADFFDKDLSYDRQRFPYFPPDWEAGAAVESELGRATIRSGVMAGYLSRYGTGR